LTSPDRRRSTRRLSRSFACRAVVHASRPVFFLMIRPPPFSTLFPYTTLFRSSCRSRPPGGCSSSQASSLRFSCSTSAAAKGGCRSEEHTSELQSRGHLVCRLLLEKKNTSGFGHVELHEGKAGFLAVAKT